MKKRLKEIPEIKVTNSRKKYILIYLMILILIGIMIYIYINDLPMNKTATPGGIISNNQSNCYKIGIFP